MHPFIFWKYFNNQSLIDFNALIQQLTSQYKQTPVYTNPFDASCSLISFDNTSCSFVSESDHAFIFSQKNDVQYENKYGQEALKLASAYAISRNKVDYSKFTNRFSILFYNKLSDTISFAVDRFGIERIYYYKNDNVFVCSSSLDLIIDALGHEKISINHQAIYNYIYFHVIPSPNTIYSDIYKVEPCESITLKNSTLTKNIYWLPTFSEKSPCSNEEQQEATRNGLRAAVIANNISDSTGSFLSGGLDSSTVSGLLAESSDRKVKTYTMGFEQAGYDETVYAKMAADKFGTDLRSYYVTPDDVAHAFNKVITYFEEPFGNSSAIPAYLCADYAKNDGMSTLLAGDGGDEIFAGNERYAKQQLFEYYKYIPSIIRKAIVEPVFNNCLFYTKHFPFSKAKSYIEQCLTPMPDRMEKFNFIHHFDADAIFDSDFLSTINKDTPINEKRAVYDRPTDASLLNRMLYLDWKFTLADNDLVKVSKSCELAGIDVRYPMLDDGLVELSTNIPSNMKMKGQHLRTFYKNTFTNFLPAEIINKQKHGFGLPFGEWLKLSPLLQEHIYDNLSALKNRTYIKGKFIDDIINIHRTDSAASYFGTMVWILAVIEEWLSSRSR